MANAQNIDKIFAEIAKKVQNEVMINLPRKVGVIAKNHFTDNRGFRLFSTLYLLIA